MKERNFGIDALRLFSMYQIVLLHVLGRGGILNASVGWTNKAAWLLEIAAFGAVNCYGIITGFVSYSEENKPYRYEKYASMWGQVFFYTFPATLAAILLSADGFGWDALPRTIFPVCSRYYWYFTAYTVVFFLIPWLNRLIRTCSGRELTGFVAAGALFLSVGSFWGDLLSGADTFRLSGGYHFAWLVYLYFIGAWLKKCGIPGRIRRSVSASVAVGCVLLTWTVKTLIGWDGAETVSYLSPAVLLSSGMTVCLFARLPVKNAGKKLISFASPAAFGIYLCHVQTVSWELFLRDRFVPLASLPLPWSVAATLGATAGIFLTAMFIEKFRQGIFRLLRIDTGLRWLWCAAARGFRRKDKRRSE